MSEESSVAAPNTRRCHRATSAIWTGSGRKSGAFPATRAVYAVIRSVTSGARDSPSHEMWCTTIPRTASVLEIREKPTRTGSSATRSNPPCITCGSAACGTSRQSSITAAAEGSWTSW